MKRHLAPDLSLVQERKRYVAARKREAAKDRSKTPQHAPSWQTWRQTTQLMGPS